MCSTLTIGKLSIDFIGKGNLWICNTYDPAVNELARYVNGEAVFVTVPGQISVLGYDDDLSGVFAPFASFSTGENHVMELVSDADELKKHLLYIQQQVQAVQNVIQGRKDSLLQFRRELNRPIEGYRLVVYGKRYKVEITREDFEKASENLLSQIQLKIEDVMRETNLSWRNIDEFLLIGGSTRMPMMKRLLESISGKTVTYKVDLDTAVAKGAALFAGTLQEKGIGKTSDSRVVRSIVVSDVTSQSLGVISVDHAGREINSIIIPHNTKIPARHSKILRTMEDCQEQIRVDVTEGNDQEVAFVKVIGQSLLSIPPHLKETPVEVVFAYADNQTVSVEVVDRTTNQNLGRFKIKRISNLTDEQVQKAADIVKKTDVE